MEEVAQSPEMSNKATRRGRDQNAEDKYSRQSLSVVFGQGPRQKIILQAVVSFWKGDSEVDYNLRVAGLLARNCLGHGKNACFLLLQNNIIMCLQCLDAVGWAAGRASGL